jgi:hypothetical protein
MKIKHLFIYIVVVTIGLSFFISCVDNEDYSIPPVPPVGFFKETFNHATKANGDPITASPWPKIAAVINFDGTASYTDVYGYADIRKLNGSSNIAKKGLFVWLPANRDATLTMDSIRLETHKNLTLRYRFNANIYNPGDVSNANKLIVKFNDVELTVPDIVLNTSNNRNTYRGISIKIPDELLREYSKLEFVGTPSNNDKGFRIDDIELIEDYPW